MSRRLPTPLADETVVQALLQRTRASSTIGDLLLFGASSLEIPPEELRRMLEERGVEEWRPVDIKPQVAARKAITLFRPALERGDLKVLVRKAWEDPQQIRYALVGEARQAATRDLAYDTLTQIVFDKKDGTLSFTRGEVPELVAIYEALCAVYTQREVLAMAKQIMRGFGGVHLKAHGTMWFMPASARGIVDGLRELFNHDLQPYGSAWFRALGVRDDDDSRAALGALIQEDFDEELKSALGALKDSVKRGKRVGGISYTINRLRALKGRAAVYDGLVQLDADWLDSVIDEAAMRATHLMIRRQVANIGADVRQPRQQVVYMLEDAEM